MADAADQPTVSTVPVGVTVAPIPACLWLREQVAEFDPVRDEFGDGEVEIVSSYDETVAKEVW